jgi:hypothetical protein
MKSVSFVIEAIIVIVISPVILVSVLYASIRWIVEQLRSCYNLISGGAR